MYCSKCGSQNRDRAKFCQKCGAKLEVETSYAERDGESSSVNTNRKESIFQMDITETGLRGALRRLIVSPLYLATMIGLTLQIVLSIMFASSGYSSFTNTLFEILDAADLDYYINSSELFGLVNAINRTSTASTIISNIPAIAICAGLWILFVQACNRNQKMDITGLTVIKVVMIVRFVLYLIGLAIGVISVFVGLAAINSYIDNGWLIVVFALIIIAVAGYMTVSFYLKVLKMIESAKDIIVVGEKTAPAYTYVIVIASIAAGLQIISSIMSLFSFGFGVFLGNVAGAVACVGFVMLMNRFNTLEMMENDLRSEEPVHMDSPKDDWRPANEIRYSSGNDSESRQNSNIFKVSDDLTAKILDDEPTELLVDQSIPEAKLINVKDHTEMRITKDRFTIGKSAGKVDGLIINNPAVSRVHAMITFNDGQFYVTDSNSTNHVFVDGEQISPETAVLLEDGMKIRFADEEYTFVKG